MFSIDRLYLDKLSHGNKVYDHISEMKYYYYNYDTIIDFDNCLLSIDVSRPNKMFYFVFPFDIDKISIEDRLRYDLPNDLIHSGILDISTY